MMASLAAADPLPPFYIGATPAPTSEEDEAWVLQASCPRINKKSHSTRYSTNHTIATPIEKFPFHPHNNCHHDNCCHQPNQSAAVATATAPSPTTTLCPSSYPEHTINWAFAKLKADLYSLMTLTAMTELSFSPNQTTSLPTHSTK